MKKIFLFLTMVAVFCGPSVKKVAIVTYVSHPDLEQCVRGIKESLAEEGFRAGKDIEIREFNAHADTAKLTRIVEGLEGKYSLIIALTTPVLEVVCQKVFKTPCVFGAVSYPLGIKGMGDNYEEHRENITGVGVPPVVDKTLKYMLSVIKRKVVGVIWTPKEVNSWLELQELKRMREYFAFKLVERMVTSVEEVEGAVKGILGENIGGIYLLHDNTVTSRCSVVIEEADKKKVPVFGPTALYAEKGVIFGISADYYKVGKKVGTIGARILRGDSPKDIPIINYAPEIIYVNQTKAKKLGLSIPRELLNTATKVF